MPAKITNKFGDVEIDPHNSKGQHDNWLSKIGHTSNNVDYSSIEDVSSEASELITKYILDLHNGKNLAKGTRRGRRSYNHLNNSRTRLRNIVKILENTSKKSLLNLDENNILNTFNAMRDGTLLNKNNKPHLCVSSYAKAFTFWRWIVRTKRKESQIVPDVTDALDTSADRKPKWHYFSLKDAEKMAELAPSLYYRALIYFLFDSGVRAPKELMNVHE